ncbi:MAG: hypothetical protein ACOYN0_14445, partial [Phycisphaerales bacterium]
EMGRLDVDTRTDVYSLGVVLYELLSGSLPFDSMTLRAAGYAELQRVIREEEPPRPSTKLSTLDDDSAAVIARARQDVREKIASELRRELEWIPLKAMRKDRSRRYPTPADLAQDVARYLAGEALDAGPESTGYRIRKLVQRHRARVIAGAAAAMLLVAGIAGTSAALFREARAKEVAETRRREAEAAKEEATAAKEEAQKQQRAAAEAKEQEAELRTKAEYRAYLANIYGAQAAITSGDYEGAKRRLEDCDPRLRNWEWYYLVAESDNSIETVELPSGEVIGASADWVAVRSDLDGRTRLFPDEARPGKEGVLDDRSEAVAFSPDGHLVALTSLEPTPGGKVSRTLIEIVRTSDFTTVATLSDPDIEMCSPTVEFTYDSKGLYYYGCDGAIRRWSLGVPSAHQRQVTEEIAPGVDNWSISDDHRLLCVWSGQGVRILDAADGRMVRSQDVGEPIDCAAVGLRGSAVAVAVGDGTRLMILDSSGSIHEVAAPDGGVDALWFSPDSRSLVVSGEASGATLLQIGGGPPVSLTEGSVKSVAWSAVGDRVLIAGERFAAWFGLAGDVSTFRSFVDPSASLAASPSGRLIACGDPLVVVETENWTLIQLFAREVGRARTHLVFSPDERYLAVAEAGSDGEHKVVVYEVTTGRSVASAQPRDSCELLWRSDSRAVLCTSLAAGQQLLLQREEASAN